jgi:hypothetical protein
MRTMCILFSRKNCRKGYGYLQNMARLGNWLHSAYSSFFETRRHGFSSPSHFLVRFRLLHLRFWGSPGGSYEEFMFSGISPCRSLKVYDVSKEYTAAIIVFYSFPTPSYIRCHFPAFVLLIDPQDGGSAFPGNTGKILLYYTPAHPRPAMANWRPAAWFTPAPAKSQVWFDWWKFLYLLKIIGAT